MAYQLTSDARYAKKAVAILLDLADKYPHYPMRATIGWEAGNARIAPNNLHEGYWISDLAGSYDLILDSPSLTQEARETIRREVLLPAARCETTICSGFNNQTSTRYAAAALFGLGPADRRGPVAGLRPVAAEEAVHRALDDDQVGAGRQAVQPAAHGVPVGDEVALGLQDHRREPRRGEVVAVGRVGGQQHEPRHGVGVVGRPRGGHRPAERVAPHHDRTPRGVVVDQPLRPTGVEHGEVDGELGDHGVHPSAGQRAPQPLVGLGPDEAAGVEHEQDVGIGLGPDRQDAASHVVERHHGPGAGGVARRVLPRHQRRAEHMGLGQPDPVAEQADQDDEQHLEETSHGAMQADRGPAVGPQGIEP